MDPRDDKEQVPPPPTPPISSSLRTIRTLRGDVEESVASGRTSVVSMAAAETERRAREASHFEDKAADPLRKAKIIGVFLFVFVAVFATGSVYFFFLNTPSGTSQNLVLPPDFIFTEQNHLLNLTGAGSDQIIAGLARARQETEGQLGSINAVVPIDTPTGIPQPISAANFFIRLDPEAPQEVIRTLQSAFLIGVHIFDGNQSFVILKPDTYETSFAGMLAWESTLPFRVGRALRPASDWLNASSTLAQVSWSDAVITNKDVRILRSREGKTLLLYSFIDRSTLVIATNEQTFGEVLRRIATVRATP